MEVDPELPVGVIFDAGVRFVMEAVQSATNDIIKLRRIDSVNFEPLAMFDKFENVCSSSDPIRKSTGSISSQTKEGNYARSI